MCRAEEGVAGVEGRTPAVIVTAAGIASGNARARRRKRRTRRRSCAFPLPPLEETTVLSQQRVLLADMYRLFVSLSALEIHV